MNTKTLNYKEWFDSKVTELPQADRLYFNDMWTNVQHYGLEWEIESTTYALYHEDDRLGNAADYDVFMSAFENAVWEWDVWPSKQQGDMCGSE